MTHHSHHRPRRSTHCSASTLTHLPPSRCRYRYRSSFSFLEAPSSWMLTADDVASNISESVPASHTSSTVDKPDISILHSCQLTPLDIGAAPNFLAHSSKTQLCQLFINSNSSIKYEPGSPSFLPTDPLEPNPPDDFALITFTFADKSALPHSSLEGCLWHPSPRLPFKQARCTSESISDSSSRNGREYAPCLQIGYSNSNNSIEQ